MRIFYAIDFTETVKDSLYNTSNEIDSYVIKGKKSRKENLHLTLRYIGEITENDLKKHLDIVKAINEGLHPFTLETSLQLGRFRKKEDIIWVGVHESKELRQLVSKLDNHLKNIDISMNPEYNPHITLYRQSKLTDELHNLPITLHEIKIHVEQITLFESTHINGVLTYLPLNK